MWHITPALLELVFVHKYPEKVISRPDVANVRTDLRKGPGASVCSTVIARVARVPEGSRIRIRIRIRKFSPEIGGVLSHIPSTLRGGKDAA